MPITDAVNQHMIGDDEFWRDLRAIGAGLADCGQYAGGGEGYLVGSIHPVSHDEQQLVDRPAFPYENGLTAQNFRNWQVPANAQGVFFFDFAPGHQSRFHYGRLGPALAVSMTDASLADDPAMGGAFTTLQLDPAPNGTLQEIAKAGVQPIRRLPNISAFVDYCENRFPTQNSRYFFVYFQSNA